MGVPGGGVGGMRSAAIPSSWRDARPGCDEDDGKRPASTRTFRGGRSGSSGGESPGGIECEMVRAFQQGVAAIHDRTWRDAGDVYGIAPSTSALACGPPREIAFVGRERVFDNRIGLGG